MVKMEKSIGDTLNLNIILDYLASGWCICFPKKLHYIAYC